jgi:hypothetical protein
MAEKIAELYGISTDSAKADWAGLAKTQRCPFLSRKCLKNRKSDPAQSIGTCSVHHAGGDVIICPHRLLERRQVFTDCIHLLANHTPGNEFHLVPEVAVSGGTIDYFIASVNRGKVEDFVGIELQTLDTTGSIWPERQRLLKRKGLTSQWTKGAAEKKGFGMNWKMTAKTILMQLHHKASTFEALHRHLVLVVQDRLLTDMKAKFDFAPFRAARNGDAVHLHAYSLEPSNGGPTIQLATRISTDAAGVAKCLGKKDESNMTLKELNTILESKISASTRVVLAK